MIGKNAKYSTGGNHNDETTLKEVEEALIESAKEADRQKLFVEKQSENLKRRLHSVKGELLTCCVVLSRDYSCDDSDDDEEEEDEDGCDDNDSDNNSDDIDDDDDHG